MKTTKRWIPETHVYFLYWTTAMLLVLVVLTGCSGVGRNGNPSLMPPPAFVLAWTAPGGAITTLESADGTAWRHRRIHDTTSSSAYGPAIAFDGQLFWMLMWKDGPELQYKTSLGGTTEQQGLTWEAQPIVGNLAVHLESSPALAYGNDRWVAVYRRGNRLEVVRSQPQDALPWESPVVLMHQDVTPRPAAARWAPALAFGTVGGQDVFVLVYQHERLGAVAATSPDGLTWSAPAVIAPAEKDPVVSVQAGRAFVVLSRTFSATGAAGSYHNYIYTSADGAGWTEIDSYPAAPNNATGPGMSVGGCRMLITEQIGGALGGTFTGIAQRVGTPDGPCGNPTGMSFGPEEPVRAEGQSANEQVGNTNARTAVAFGGSTTLAAHRTVPVGTRYASTGLERLRH